MEESLNSLVKTIDSQAQKVTKELIRNKIYKGINELRKNDDEFSRRLEIEEINFWYNLLRECKNSNLINLVNIYDCLKNLKYNNNNLKDLLNKE